MMEQKIDPPNLCFWTLAIKDFQIILAIFQKNQLDAVETGKIWNETKVVKKSKNFIFKSFFLYDGAENRPPLPMFLNSCYKGLPNYTSFFQKNQLDAGETGKFWNEINVVKKSKNFIFKSFFLYDGAENRPPNLCFWTLAIKDFQIILAIVQKNQLDAGETGKLWNETKVVKKSKNFIFKSFFLYDGAENRSPQPMFLNSCYKGLPNYTCYFPKKSVGCSWNWKILKQD